MIRIPLIFIACLLTACGSMPLGMSAEALVGAPVVDRGFVGHGPTATIRIKQRITNRTWCEFEHVSYLTSGVPFGERTEEDALNQVGCGIRFGATD